jgi:hypothetical protein
MKVKFSVIANNQCLTMNQTLSRKWNEPQIKSWLAVAQYTHPRVDSYIYVKNKHYYTMKKSDIPTRLLVSGNINEWKKSLYYNVQYCRIAEDNAPNSMNIEMDGQWVDSSRFLNICGDSPRVFNIKRPDGCEGCICRLRLEYDAGYSIEQNRVITNPSGLRVVDCKRTDVVMSKEEINKWMLEYDIISS